MSSKRWNNLKCNLNMLILSLCKILLTPSESEEEEFDLDEIASTLSEKSLCTISNKSEDTLIPETASYGIEAIALASFCGNSNEKRLYASSQSLPTELIFHGDIDSFHQSSQQVVQVHQSHSVFCGK